MWFVCISFVLLYHQDIQAFTLSGSRYLLVRCYSPGERHQPPPAEANVPFVNLDPKHAIKFGKKAIKIPEPSYKLQKLLIARSIEYVKQHYDEDDMRVFEGDDSNILSQISNVQKRPSLASQRQSQHQDRAQDDEEKELWRHDPAWVKECLPYAVPPPIDALPMATMALQKELKAVLRDQEAAKSLKELGWYMPVEYIGDNLFQWIVELHSLEEDLPIAKDMKRL